MTSDAVTLIKNDHRLVEHLFAQLQAGKGDRQELADEITARLTAHARAEEQQVYRRSRRPTRARPTRSTTPTPSTPRRCTCSGRSATSLVHHTSTRR